MRKRARELKKLINREKPDIVCISETLMNDNTIPTPIFGYKSIQKRKPEGRGVALYHKNDNKLQIETINWEILSVWV